MTRLCSAIFVSAALLLSGVARGAWAQAVDDFRRLPEFVSRNHMLNATLVAEARDITLDGVRLHALTFNGDYGGPVLRLAPGDDLRLQLVNRTDKPVNVHFHGSHGSPLGHGDNMYVSVEPGNTYRYDVHVPITQPPGLYWYHTHIHGLAEEEIGRGLSGAMIIEGIERRVPEVTSARSRLMVLKTYAVDPSTGGSDAKRLHGIVQSINGQVHTDIAAQAGGAELWRISNQSPNDYYHLSAKGFAFKVVGIDGATTNQDIPVSTLEVPPAGTLEAIVTVPAAGTYPLLSGSTPTGVGKAFKLVRELATIHVTGDAHPPIQTVIMHRAPTTPDLRQAKISAKREIVFSQKTGEEVYFINGKTYDHMRIDIRLPLGSIEEWTIRNDTDDMHVFHIHQLHFQVVAINGEPQPFDGVIDDVRVPERGSVTLRIPFTDPQIVGRFMYHCHVLKHEDKGMMANIEVYDPTGRIRIPPAPKMAPMNGMKMSALTVGPTR